MYKRQQFVLYKEVTSETGTSTLYYKWNADKKVEWVADMKDATVVKTDENGAATFGGLANGDYYLVETKAPAGYNQLTEPYKVTVAGSDTAVSYTHLAQQYLENVRLMSEKGSGEL